MILRVIFLFIGLWSGSLSSFVDDAAAWGNAALEQIQTLQTVVTARANYFSSPNDVVLAAQYLTDAKKSLQLFIDDSQSAEVGWFLVEEIAKKIGTVGTDVWIGNDVSGYLAEFANQSDINGFGTVGSNTRVWSTTFCIEVRRHIFGQLLRALRLIPLTTPTRLQAQPPRKHKLSRAPGVDWLPPKRVSRWRKVSPLLKAAIISGCVSLVLVGGVYTFVMLRERFRG
ncbi:MAG: hypothetical protein QG632_482 [Candidatus Dependentiae bacterium]|nr:hypothetical protein [Candidatus Dependentiae bacterium]